LFKATANFIRVLYEFHATTLQVFLASYIKATAMFGVWTKRRLRASRANQRTHRSA